MDLLESPTETLSLSLSLEANAALIGDVFTSRDSDSLIMVVLGAPFLREAMGASSSGTSEPVKDDTMVEFVRNFLHDYQTRLALQDSGAGLLARPAWNHL